MKSTTLLTLALAACFTSGPICAETNQTDELKKAQKELEAANYEAAFQGFLRVAEKNDDALSQFNLGLFYRYGWGRSEDPVAACRWFKKAAIGKIPAAAHFYAESLEHGIGCPQDVAEAAVWYREAADLGHHLSLCALADLHINGRGVEKDPRKAVELCNLAVAHRAHGAEVQLGRYLLEGDDAVRNEAGALACFQAAAQKQSAEGQFHLATMLREGRGGPKHLASARHWFESAAAQAYVPAYLPTAELYFNAPPDPKTGKLSADHLAKAYLWLCGTEARSTDREELARARAMLKKVRAVMPEAWTPSLDAKVAQHIDKTSKPEPQEQ